MKRIEKTITWKDSKMTQTEIETTIDWMVQYIKEHWWDFQDLLESGKIQMLEDNIEAQIVLAEYVQQLFLCTDRTTRSYVSCLEQGARMVDCLSE